MFTSTTRTGHTRGQHWHRRKVERFAVLAGEGVVRMRRLFTDDVYSFRVGPGSVIDMPTMWTHSLTATSALSAVFYSDALFDPDRPDTHPEDV